MFMVVVYCDGYIKCTTFDQGFYKVTVIVWYRTQWAFVLNFVGIYIYIYIYIYIVMIGKVGFEYWIIIKKYPCIQI